MKLVNLTPHPIVLRDAQGNDHTVPPCGTVARVTASPGALHTVDGVPVPVAAPSFFGAVVGLPPVSQSQTCGCMLHEWDDMDKRSGCPLCGSALRVDALFIVSAIVGAACKGRADVVCPGTGPADGAIRNEHGHIVAVTRLVRP